MRILVFAAGGDIGGGKTHILNLTHELSRTNELRLVCFRVGEMSRAAQAMGINTVAVDVKKGFGYAKNVAMREAINFNPDVIHCHGSKANLLGVLVKKQLGITVMTTVHSDPEIDYMGAPLRNITYGNLNRWALRHMDYYVCVSKALQDLLIQRKFDPYKIDFINNAIGFEEGIEYKINSETVTVGVAARLNPVKDIPTLVKAFAIAYNKNDKLRLSIAGIGEEEKKLRELVSELGIEKVTTFEGWISDVKSFFSRVDINALSSISEGFPYSILEGAMMHVPAVASRVGSIPDIIINNETGIMFEAGDVDALAKAITTLAENPDLRKRLGDNLYKKAKADFSLEEMCEKCEGVYSRLIARQNQPDRNGAIICGAYGKSNAGDESILRAIITSLKQIDDDMPIYVMSRKPTETSVQTHVRSFFIFDIFKLRRISKNIKLFISGGGTLIQDATSTRSLLFYLFAIRVAKRAGAKVQLYGCGIGPIKSSRNRKLTSRILNEYADVITLRDSESQILLSEINVDKPEIILAADPTVNLPAVEESIVESAFNKAAIPFDAKKIIFCMRPWGEFSDLGPIISAAEYAYEKYNLIPIFLPMEYPRDVEIGKEIAESLSIPCYVSTNKHPIEELRGMLAHADLVVGMRLHSLIFAASAGSPIIGISYDVKVDSFIKDSGAKRIIDVFNLTSEDLIKNIDLALSDGRAMGLETKVRLQELEKKNAEVAQRLLGDK
ncbi:MAG: polysaccharide pyruvyl transferase CsaB [Bacillota bacterium]|nr:polysaccharide pyruvyl transferase CsaB [Bacillota bacterium]